MKLHELAPGIASANKIQFGAIDTEESVPHGLPVGARWMGSGDAPENLSGRGIIRGGYRPSIESFDSMS